MVNITAMTDRAGTARRRRKVWNRFVRVVAMVVVFCTTYALILPAITMESDTICGITAHTHTEACYQTVEAAACTLEENEGHAHSEPDCYTYEDSALICTLEEAEAHAHTDGCYAQTLTCGKEEQEAHIHGDGCYGEVSTLVCETAEAEGHTHSDSCYTETATLVCEVAEAEGHTHDDSCYTENAQLICDQEHEHLDACYQTESVLTCETAEAEGHAHGESCYVTESVLTCETAEAEGHTHADSCYAAETSLTCEIAESEGHTHSDTCYENTLTCEIAESEGHTHSETCYGTASTLTCTLEESEGHSHADDSTEPVVELICEIPEHVHVEECYPETEPTEESTDETTLPEGDPNADLETSEDWEASLEAVKLSGIWHDDVLAVAESQLGYQESTLNYIMEGDGSAKGITRYGQWYGNPYGDWCAMFVSFCIRYAEISNDVFPIRANCAEWINQLDVTEEELLAAQTDGIEVTDRFSTPEEYTPVPGDLIFFDFNHDGTSDHIGLVKEVTEAVPATETAKAIPAMVKTIEGNSDNRVQYLTYELGSSDILGYGILPTEPGLVYTYADENVEVEVRLPEGTTVPADAVLKVTPIVEEDEGYEDLVQQAEEAVEGTVKKISLYDISFYSAEDDYIEVADTAKVSMRFPQNEVDTTAEVQVLHFADEEEAPVVLEEVVVEEREVPVETTEATEPTDETTPTEETAATEPAETEIKAVVEFETDGFSTFAVVEVYSTVINGLDLTKLDGKTYIITAVNILNNVNPLRAMSSAKTTDNKQLVGVNVTPTYNEAGDTVQSVEVKAGVNGKDVAWTFEAVNADERQYHIKSVSTGEYLWINDNSSLTTKEKPTDSNDPGILTNMLFTVENANTNNNTNTVKNGVVCLKANISVTVDGQTYQGCRVNLNTNKVDGNFSSWYTGIDESGNHLILSEYEELVTGLGGSDYVIAAVNFNKVPDAGSEATAEVTPTNNKDAYALTTNKTDAELGASNMEKTGLKASTDPIALTNDNKYSPGNANRIWTFVDAKDENDDVIPGNYYISCEGKYLTISPRGLTLEANPQAIEVVRGVRTDETYPYDDVYCLRVQSGPDADGNPVYSYVNVSGNYAGHAFTSWGGSVASDKELLINGDFTNNTNAWETPFGFGAPGSWDDFATLEIINEEAVVFVYDEPVHDDMHDDWTVQLRQDLRNNNVEIEHGHTYELVFYAKSSVERNINITVMSNDSSVWYGGGSVLLQESEGLLRYSIPITMWGEFTTATDACLNINMGITEGETFYPYTITFDNFSLKEIDSNADAATDQTDAGNHLLLLKKEPTEAAFTATVLSRDELRKQAMRADAELIIFVRQYDADGVAHYYAVNADGTATEIYLEGDDTLQRGAIMSVRGEDEDGDNFAEIRWDATGSATTGWGGSNAVQGWTDLWPQSVDDPSVILCPGPNGEVVMPSANNTLPRGRHHPGFFMMDTMSAGVEEGIDQSITSIIGSRLQPEEGGPETRNHLLYENGEFVSKTGTWYDDDLDDDIEVNSNTAFYVASINLNEDFMGPENETLVGQILTREEFQSAAQEYGGDYPFIILAKDGNNNIYAMDAYGDAKQVYLLEGDKFEAGGRIVYVPADDYNSNRILWDASMTGKGLYGDTLIAGGTNDKGDVISPIGYLNNNIDGGAVDLIMQNVASKEFLAPATSAGGSLTAVMPDLNDPAQDTHDLGFFHIKTIANGVTIDQTIASYLASSEGSTGSKGKYRVQLVEDNGKKMFKIAGQEGTLGGVNCTAADAIYVAMLVDWDVTVSDAPEANDGYTHKSVAEYKPIPSVNENVKMYVFNYGAAVDLYGQYKNETVIPDEVKPGVPSYLNYGDGLLYRFFYRPAFNGEAIDGTNDPNNAGQAAAGRGSNLYSDGADLFDPGGNRIFYPTLIDGYPAIKAPQEFTCELPESDDHKHGDACYNGDKTAYFGEDYFSLAYLFDPVGFVTNTVSDVNAGYNSLVIKDSSVNGDLHPIVGGNGTQVNDSNKYDKTVQVDCTGTSFNDANEEPATVALGNLKPGEYVVEIGGYNEAWAPNLLQTDIRLVNNNTQYTQTIDPDNVVLSNGAARTGQVFGNIGGANNGTVQFAVNVPVEGDYTLSLRYAVNGTRTFNIHVTGGSTAPAAKYDPADNPNYAVQSYPVSDGFTTGLFQKDENGFYYYDSKANAAVFNGTRFDLYDYTIIPSGYNNMQGGNFLPFNDAYQGRRVADDNTVFSGGDPILDTIQKNDRMYKLNGFEQNDNTTTGRQSMTDMWMGMSMEIDFTMTEDGKVAVTQFRETVDGVKELQKYLDPQTGAVYWYDEATRIIYNNFGARTELTEDTLEPERQDLIFHFAGDDDVLVYINDVLIMDMNGIHGVWDGTINFKTGEVTNDHYAGAYTDGKTIAQLVNAAKDAGYTVDLDLGEGDFDNTLKAHTNYTLKFFYLERGGNISDCAISFNLEMLPQGGLTITKEVQGLDQLNNIYGPNGEKYNYDGDYTFQLINIVQPYDGALYTQNKESQGVVWNVPYTIKNPYKNTSEQGTLRLNPQMVTLEYDAVNDKGVTVFDGGPREYELCRFYPNGLGETFDPDTVDDPTEKAMELKTDEFGSYYEVYRFVNGNQVEFYYLADIEDDKIFDHLHLAFEWENQGEDFTNGHFFRVFDSDTFTLENHETIEMTDFIVGTLVQVKEYPATNGVELGSSYWWEVTNIASNSPIGAGREEGVVDEDGNQVSQPFDIEDNTLVNIMCRNNLKPVNLGIRKILLNEDGTVSQDTTTPFTITYSFSYPTSQQNVNPFIKEETWEDLKNVNLYETVLKELDKGEEVIPPAANQKAVASIADPGIDEWDVQLKSAANIKLEKDHTYQLTFKASSTNERQIKVALMSTDGNFTWYGGDTLMLKPDEQTFTVTFKMNKETYDNAQLSVNMGQLYAGDPNKHENPIDCPPSVITLDDFSLVDITEDEVGSNVNLIANGDFENGARTWELVNPIGSNEFNVVPVTDYSDQFVQGNLLRTHKWNTWTLRNGVTYGTIVDTREDDEVLDKGGNPVAPYNGQEFQTRIVKENLVYAEDTVMATPNESGLYMWTANIPFGSTVQIIEIRDADGKPITLAEDGYDVNWSFEGWDKTDVLYASKEISLDLDGDGVEELEFEENAPLQYPLGDETVNIDQNTLLNAGYSTSDFYSKYGMIYSKSGSGSETPWIALCATDNFITITNRPQPKTTLEKTVIGSDDADKEKMFDFEYYVVGPNETLPETMPTEGTSTFEDVGHNGSQSVYIPLGGSIMIKELEATKFATSFEVYSHYEDTRTFTVAKDTETGETVERTLKLYYTGSMTDFTLTINDVVIQNPVWTPCTDGDDSYIQTTVSLKAGEVDTIAISGNDIDNLDHIAIDGESVTEVPAPTQTFVVTPPGSGAAQEYTIRLFCQTADTVGKEQYSFTVNDITVTGNWADADSTTYDGMTFIETNVSLTPGEANEIVIGGDDISKLDYIDVMWSEGKGKEINIANIYDPIQFHYTNDGGYALPNTGGTGTYQYTIGGVLLLLAAFALLLYYHTKRGKEDYASS